jgi:hypothetical protein
MGAAVDQIAEKDYPGLGGAAPGVVRFDRGEQRIQQIEPTVDVSDRVYSLSRGYAAFRSHGEGAAAEKLSEHRMSRL